MYASQRQSCYIKFSTKPNEAIIIIGRWVSSIIFRACGDLQLVTIIASGLQLRGGSSIIMNERMPSAGGLFDELQLKSVFSGTSRVLDQCFDEQILISSVNNRYEESPPRKSEFLKKPVHSLLYLLLRAEWFGLLLDGNGCRSRATRQYCKLAGVSLKTTLTLPRYVSFTAVLLRYTT